MDSSHRYLSYADMMRSRYGMRIQKLSIDAGFTCPNRDGRLSTTGCTFCNNTAFNPSYCHTDSQSPLREVKPIGQQIDEGIAFHAHRYRRATRYMAYFQAYSNTYAPMAVLRSRYEEALGHPQISGIAVGTRPDCVDEERLDYLAQIAQSHIVAVEYGIESCYDETLRRVNRGHSMADTEHALRLTAERGLLCGAHLIIGLPGESREQIIAEVDVINRLPLQSLKLHQLQILRGTTMAQQIVEGAEPPAALTLKDYVATVCDMLERLRPDIAIERLAGEVPPRYQLLPERAWRSDDGRYVRHEQIAPMVDAELLRRGTRQGSRYDGADYTTIL